MPLTVETGVGLPAADSYVSVADADAYAANYGLVWTGDTSTKESALRRGTAFIDFTYRNRFPGYRKNRRLQALEWPRVAAFARTPETDPSFSYGPGFDGAFNSGDFDLLGYDALPSDAVPIEIARATIVAAATALTTTGSLTTGTTTTDPTPAGEIKRESAGDHVIEYYQSRAGSTTTTSVTSGGSSLGLAIEGVLYSILIAQSGYTVRASRG